MGEKEKCSVGSACEFCDISGTCSPKEKQYHEQERLARKLVRIRHKVMVMSGKGGVGKSTIATNLAASLALRHFHVGILDADIHGPNVAKMLGVESRHLVGRVDGVEPVEIFKNFKAVSMAFLGHDPDKAIVWRGPVKHAAIKQFIADVNWGDLDVLVIDLPPGTGDEPLSVAHVIKDVDGSLIVTTPQDVSLLDSRKAINFSRLIRVPVLGIVENMSGMVCPHCDTRIELFKVGGGEKAALEMGVPFLGRIPIDHRVVESCDTGKPFVTDSVETEAMKAFRDITQKVIDALESSGREEWPAAQ